MVDYVVRDLTDVRISWHRSQNRRGLPLLMTSHGSCLWSCGVPLSSLSSFKGTRSGGYLTTWESLVVSRDWISVGKYVYIATPPPPPPICCLYGCSNTDIHSLPLTLGMLRNCWEITLNGLRIANAPQHLLPGSGRGSTRHLLAYLRAQLRHCVPYNRMKLMVVGLQGRGKTTLLSVLRNPNSPLPENVSTVGVVVNDWVIQPPRSKSQKVSLCVLALRSDSVLFSREYNSTAV